LRNINKIIIHCSATPEGRDVSMETIKKWHTEDFKWSDIGYHFVIELDGSLRKGRALSKVGAHAKGHNRDSIGICYVGGVDANMEPKDTRTEAQKDMLEDIVFVLAHAYGVAKENIKGHNEVSSKSCPSFNVREWVKTLPKI